MTHHDHKSEESSANRRSGYSIRSSLVLLGVLLIGGFLLVSEHRAHAFGALIFALPFVCVLMHLFGHGHGGHEEHQDQNRERSPS